MKKRERMCNIYLPKIGVDNVLTSLQMRKAKRQICREHTD